MSEENEKQRQIRLWQNMERTTVETKRKEKQKQTKVEKTRETNVKERSSTNLRCVQFYFLSSLLGTK